MTTIRSNVTKKDYKDILTYYKLPIPSSNRLLKITAEKIIAEKLCKCIKKIDPVNEAKSIGICTKTIFNNRGYTRGKFNCKTNPSVKFQKTNKNKTKPNKSKTRKNK
jgi:hypothetical protein